MLKTLGIIAWTGCLLVLAYQAVSWVIFAAWPSLTLMDMLASVFGIDSLSLAETLPFDIAFKAAYVCFTTQLNLFLWWTGVTFFGLAFVTKTVTK